MDNTNVKNSQRKNSGHSNTVDDEIQKLFKRSGGKINQQDFINLRNKYGDERLVEKIQKGFVEKYTEITKRAKKFAQLIREKYSNSQYPFHILLEKALKYKVKHGLTDEEFREFQRIFEIELVGLKSPEVFTVNTNLQKVLGNVSVDYQGFTSELNDADAKVLQDILKLHASSKALHAQVLLQSMQYEDCGIEALTGEYDKKIHNVASHIHPVIAALFFPKIDVVEQHFIHSNISNIVKTRYNKEQFTSMADALLYDALIKDPMDVVCDSRSIIVDLFNRAQLQNQLWNCVLALRNGQYYNSSFREFINAVDICRMNKYDSPDLVYGRYDGTVIKRLLSAFSFRPTVVTTTPVYQIFNTNPYQQNIRPTVTYVPMINLKLPFVSNDNSPIELLDALEQTQLLLENGNVIPKHTSLIYSRGVLIFYVDRRANIIHNTQTTPSFSLIKLPTAVSGFERLNDRPVDFKDHFQIRNDEYQLRSVVLSETNSISEEKNLVVGSTAAIRIYPDLVNRFQEEFFLYDPYCVAKPQIVNNTLMKYNPIQQIVKQGINLQEIGFNEMARKRGIIFIYQLTKDSSAGTITF
jgi:Poxvirus P4B major core protein